jgi:hypothetical protein
VTIEDAGHFVHEDNLPAFLADVTRFLSKGQAFNTLKRVAAAALLFLL